MTYNGARDPHVLLTHYNRHEYEWLKTNETLPNDLRVCTRCVKKLNNVHQANGVSNHRTAAYVWTTKVVTA